MTCPFHKPASNFDCLRHVTRLMVYHLTVSWEGCRREPTSPKWDLQLVDHSLSSRKRNSVAKTSASALEPNSDGTSFRERVLGHLRWRGFSTWADSRKGFSARVWLGSGCTRRHMWKTRTKLKFIDLIDTRLNIAYTSMIMHYYTLLKVTIIMMIVESKGG